MQYFFPHDSTKQRYFRSPCSKWKNLESHCDWLLNLVTTRNLVVVKPLGCALELIISKSSTYSTSFRFSKSKNYYINYKLEGTIRTKIKEILFWLPCSLAQLVQLYRY